jgi:Tfp pilus assembly protein PilP
MVVEKTVKNATANAAPAATASAKPAPSNAKVTVVAAPAAKPAPALAKPGAGKPAVVAVQPPTAKTAAAPPAKAVAVSGKPASGTVGAVKPAPATPARAVAAAPEKPAKNAPPAAKAVAVPVVAAANAKDPFAKNKKAAATVTPVPKPSKAVAGGKSAAGTTVAVNETKAADEKKPEVKKVNAAGRRDPFISPVVRMGAIGSGCSSGKRCLAIDQIALKGVVKSDSGMIAVVVNALDKAYFLRENDPVFNGYVTKITPDSIVFKETFHDKLGKPLTRDVTKTISRPAA